MLRDAPPVEQPVAAGLASDKRTQRNILIAMCTALVAVIASVSGLNVAQQQLAIDLGASQSNILWIINAYTVALAALLMPVGAIGDRWGRKPVLLVGLALFGLASAGAALATTTSIMILARIVAGIGAAMIMPVTLSVITSSFPAESRSQAIGVWAGFAGSGGLIGLFVSAFTVDIVTWRWLFLLPITLVAVSAVMTVRHVPNSREGGHRRFDTVGSVLSAVAIGGLVFGIHEGPERGWSDSLTLITLVLGGIALFAFVRWERRQAEPLLDMATFADRRLSAGTSTLAIIFAVMFGIFLTLFPFLQGVLGWSALRSAVSMLPMAAMMMPTSALSPKIVARFGARLTMVAGLAVFMIGLVTLSLRASADGGYFSILPGLIVIGFGIGLAMTPSTDIITQALPLEQQGVASALNDTSREIGGALGVALLGSILNSTYRSTVESDLADMPGGLAEAAGEGLGAAFGVAQQAGPDAPRIISVAQHAFVDGWVRSMWVGAVLVAAGLVHLIVRGPSDNPATPTN